LGLILDSSVLIQAERGAETVSGLLRRIKMSTGHKMIAMSAISVIEPGHGIWRADTAERAERRSLYLREVYAAIRVEPFTQGDGRAGGTDQRGGKKKSKVIPFADLQIGVTALESGYEIATYNQRHFGMIPGLVIALL